MTWAPKKPPIARMSASTHDCFYWKVAARFWEPHWNQRDTHVRSSVRSFHCRDCSLQPQATNVMFPSHWAGPTAPTCYVLGREQFCFCFVFRQESLAKVPERCRNVNAVGIMLDLKGMVYRSRENNQFIIQYRLVHTWGVMLARVRKPEAANTKVWTNLPPIQRSWLGMLGCKFLHGVVAPTPPGKAEWLWTSNN